MTLSLGGRVSIRTREGTGPTPSPRPVGSGPCESSLFEESLRARVSPQPGK